MWTAQNTPGETSLYRGWNIGVEKEGVIDNQPLGESIDQSEWE